MISTNLPLFAKSMSVPKEMNQLSVEAFTAGIVEAALDGLGFVSQDLERERGSSIFTLFILALNFFPFLFITFATSPLE